MVSFHNLCVRYEEKVSILSKKFKKVFILTVTGDLIARRADISGHYQSAACQLPACLSPTETQNT
mgnify:CR=1 FL=1